MAVDKDLETSSGGQTNRQRHSGQDKGDTDYLITQGNGEQVETISNKGRHTGDT